MLDRFCYGDDATVVDEGNGEIKDVGDARALYDESFTVVGR